MSRAGTILENSMSYVHTIRIPWPSITYTSLERQSSNMIQARFLQCVSHNTMIDEINAIFTDRIRILRERLLPSRAMIPSLGNVDRHPTKQRKRRDASKSLRSDFCKMMDNSASDNSILGTLGKVTNALMGAPSTADIITSAEHVCEMGALSKLNADEIVKSNTRLTSFMELSHKELQNIDGGLASIKKRITDTNKHRPRTGIDKQTYNRY